MTPEQRRFEAALRERLQQRARSLVATDQDVMALLRQARERITQILIAQPSDWQQWHLQRLRDQIDQVLAASGQDAGTVLDRALRELWQQGEDLIDKPLAAAGIGVEAQLGVMDVRVLHAMRTFAVDRIRNITAEAGQRIAQQLGLVTIGGVTPYDAIKVVQGILGDATPRRATTVVRTETSRAFAVASLQRLRESARIVPGLGKQWRRSGKMHSRWQHDLIDGEVVGVDEPFKVPNPNGGVDLMQCPHDPAAPAEQVINCGCTLLPHKRDWQVMHPGAKPFTARELARDPGKAYMDAQAKQVGRRLEPLPGADKAVIAPAKLAGYSLDPDHPEGRHKARVIAATLGYSKADAADFEAAIRAGLATHLARTPTASPYGVRYTVDMVLTGPKGSGTLRTGWIVDTGSDVPRLVSAYIKPEKS